MQAILDEFDESLALQCGRSANTRRAYLGDVRSLFAFLEAPRNGAGIGLDGLSVPVLRTWLAAAAGAGAARPAHAGSGRSAASAQGPSHPAGGAAPRSGAACHGGCEIRCPARRSAG